MFAAYRSTGAVPRVLLPTGVTTSPRPRIEWKQLKDVAAWQARIRLANPDSSNQSVCWESEVLDSAQTHTIPEADLPSHVSLYVEVRPKWNDGWAPWGLPSAFRIEPVCPLRGGIVVYDLHYTRKLGPLQAFAHTHLVSALQGLVNRVEPQLYVNFVHGHPEYASAEINPQDDIDQFWLERLRKEDGWLGEVMVRKVTHLPDLLELFGDAFSGLVAWDPSVPATSNIASTIAGADGLLPVPCCNDPASLYHLLAGELGLPVKVDLRGKFPGRGIIPDTTRKSTGSPKCDAYLWAVDNYLLTGRADPCWMGHYLDAWWIRNPAPGGNWQNHTLTNHDYFISRRGFFWDLNVWPDEPPVDDPEQKLGTDAETLREILETANRLTNCREMIHAGGFTPWSFKYTNHGTAGGTHEPVETEWELARILSAYNAFVDADALGLGAMANASFVCHYPLPQYAPVLAYTPDELKAEGHLTDAELPAEKDYVLNYVGDYDSAAWAWNSLSLIWETNARGKVPMAWAINPNLASRAAPIFEHMYRTRTANDHFITGDSGAGYVNPTQLLSPRTPSKLPDAAGVWIRHCTKWYRRFGLKMTGFLINGLAGPITDAAERMYLGISQDGIVNQYGRSTDKLHHAGNRMPVFELLADIERVADGIVTICGKAAECGERPRFMVFRQILKSPDWYVSLLAGLLDPATNLKPVFCDPHTFAGLARARLGIDNKDQYSLLFNSLPELGKCGEGVLGDVGLRNDGWNTWTPREHELQLQVFQAGSGNSIWKKSVSIPAQVMPGESVVLAVELLLPDFPGEYHLEMDMAHNGVPFSSRGGYTAEQRLVVKRVDITAAV